MFLLGIHFYKYIICYVHLKIVTKKNDIFIVKYLIDRIKNELLLQDNPRIFSGFRDVRMKRNRRTDKI